MFSALSYVIITILDNAAFNSNIIYGQWVTGHWQTAVWPNTSLIAVTIV